MLPLHPATLKAYEKKSVFKERKWAPKSERLFVPVTHTSASLPMPTMDPMPGTHEYERRFGQRPRHWHALRKLFPYNRWDTDPATAYKRKHIVNAMPPKTNWLVLFILCY